MLIPSSYLTSVVTILLRPSLILNLFSLYRTVRPIITLNILFLVYVNCVSDRKTRALITGSGYTVIEYNHLSPVSKTLSVEIVRA